jgi:hypothetical protein
MLFSTEFDERMVAKSKLESNGEEVVTFQKITNCGLGQHTFGLIMGNTKRTSPPNDFIKDDGKSINISLLGTAGSDVRFTKQLRCLPEQICKQSANNDEIYSHIIQKTPK